MYIQKLENFKLYKRNTFYLDNAGQKIYIYVHCRFNNDVVSVLVLYRSNVHTMFIDFSTWKQEDEDR